MISFLLGFILVTNSIVPLLQGEVILPTLYGDSNKQYYIETATDINGPWTRVTDCEELSDGSVRLFSHGTPKFFVRLAEVSTYQY